MKEFFFIGSISKNKFEISASQWFGENGELLDLWFKPKPKPKTFLGNYFNFWRYLDVLPLANPSEIISLGETFTPLSEINFSNGLRAKVKQDQFFPTGSYKDRGAAVLISFLKSLGTKHVIQDSSGNAGTSIAAYAARAGISCEIFLPEDTSMGKIVQMQSYGANINKIAGDREATAKATLLAAKDNVYASHCYNPVFLQGTKTFAYELIEQLNFKSPEAVVVPAGNGTLLLGCYIGFSELYEAGIIHKIPKLIAVQSDACNPLYRKHFGLNPIKKAEKTLAEGIAILNPVRGNQMLEAVKKSNGCFISVAENEIIEAWKEVSKQGFFIEPTSAATIAGLIKYANQTENSHDIVSLFSGNGLKSLDKINQFAFES
jgi:threonine synthase